MSPPEIDRPLADPTVGEELTSIVDNSGEDGKVLNDEALEVLIAQYDANLDDGDDDQENAAVLVDAEESAVPNADLGGAQAVLDRFRPRARSNPPVQAGGRKKAPALTTAAANTTPQQTQATNTSAQQQGLQGTAGNNSSQPASVQPPLRT